MIHDESEKKQTIIPKLKIDHKTDLVILDNQTSMEGIPNKAYEYKLGLRSPVEWILDQHKPKKATASDMANYKMVYEKFNTPQSEQKRYEQISKPLLIDLIPRLANLSLKTLEIREKIQKATEE